MACVDHFHFVHALQYDLSPRIPVSFRAAGDPVDTFWQGMGAVGFDVDDVTGFLEGIYELIIELQGGFATGEAYVGGSFFEGLVIVRS